jgi:hypothetical protein
MSMPISEKEALWTIGQLNDVIRVRNRTIELLKAAMTEKENLMLSKPNHKDLEFIIEKQDQVIRDRNREIGSLSRRLRRAESRVDELKTTVGVLIVLMTVAGLILLLWEGA